MLFCGQCGLQLAPGSTTCPRCGTATQQGLPQDNQFLDDPTIASNPRLPLQPSQTPFPQTPGYSPLPPSQTPYVSGPGTGSSNSNPYSTEQVPNTPPRD